MLEPQISFGPEIRQIETGPASINWCWGNGEGTDRNHIYAAKYGKPWSKIATVEDSECWYGSLGELPYGLVFLVVTAENEHGESPTEHGEYPGDI